MNDDKDPRDRIMILERESEKTKLEIGYLKSRLDKSDDELIRIYEKLDSMKNMVIASLISTILTLIGVISLYIKG